MPTEAVPPSAPRSTRGARLWQWFWRGREIRRVRELVASDPRQERSRRAQVAVEVADRAFDPVDPPAYGSTLPLALSCYREAAYWALLARDGTLDAGDLSTALAASPPDVIAFAAGGDKALANLRRDFVNETFVHWAGLQQDELVDVARAARAFVHALLQGTSGPEQQLSTLYRQRRRHVVASIALLLVGLVGGVLGYRRLTLAPDLALGKPWRASSRLADCQPQIERCAGARTKMFFSTLPEDNPWFEIDLGRSYAVSRVEIDNRTDCCVDRARGLLVELSTDAQRWVTVARQPQSFQFWTARFPSQQARFVRLSVPRQTVLHLERVAVRQR